MNTARLSFIFCCPMNSASVCGRSDASSSVCFAVLFRSSCMSDHLDDVIAGRAEVLRHCSAPCFNADVPVHATRGKRMGYSR